MNKSWISWIKTVLPLALGIYLIWFFFHGMSEESLSYFYLALKEANYFWIALALGLTFVAYASRAYRWKYVLEPLGYNTPFWHRYHALMIGYLINMTIPRAGEASRAAMLYRSDGVPFSKSFGTIIGERAVDLVMLGSITCFTLFMASDNFHAIFEQIQSRFSAGTSSGKDEVGVGSIVLYILLALLLAFIVLLILKPAFRSKFVQFGKDVITGLFSVFKSSNPLAYLAHTFLIWALYLLFFGIAFFSLDDTSDFPIEGILMAFLAGSVGIMFTNGGIGAFPLLVGLVVVFYLGDEEPQAQAIGNAIGMLIWVSQTIFLIILGLLSLFLLPNNYSKENVKN